MRKNVSLILLFIGVLTLFSPTTRASTADLDLSVPQNYNFIFTGGGGIAGKIEANGNAAKCDIDGDGRDDFIVGAFDADYNGRANSGSVWVVSSKILDSYSGTGNVIDISQTQNYKYRFDGVAAGDNLSHGYLGCGDVNADGTMDLLMGTYHGAGDGNLWVVYNSVFAGVTGTGNNFDLATSSNWSLRFDSNANISDFTHIGTSAQVVDINGDSQNDLIIGSQKGRGGVFILYHNLIDSFDSVSPTGNVVNLATATNYNIRFYGADDATVFTAERGIADDLDNNGNKDLIVRAGRYSTFGSSVYVIKDNLFLSIAGTGNNVDLATSANYSFRLLAPSPMGIDGVYGIITGDIYGDGKRSLVLQENWGTYNDRDNSGAVYVIDSVLTAQMFLTGGTFDISASPDNYSFRFDGAVSQGMTGQLEVLDFDNDGIDDIIVSEPMVNIKGKVFYVFDSIYKNGGVKNYDLANTAHYSNSLTAPFLFLLGVGGQGPENKFGDYNGDGKIDSFFVNNATGAYSGTGVLYLIYNYPHTFSISPINDSFLGETVNLHGSVAAIDSTTNTAMVEYQVDSNAITGNWNNCISDSGVFNTTAAIDFTCSITGLSLGSHTVYVRAYDSNFSYTAQANYASEAVNIIPVHPSGGSKKLFFQQSSSIPIPLTTVPNTNTLPVSSSFSKEHSDFYDFGTKTLKLNSRGEVVKELQRFLNKALNLNLITDGKFGKATLLAVKKWQKENNLIPDGIVGRRTREKINTTN